MTKKMIWLIAVLGVAAILRTGYNFIKPKLDQRNNLLLRQVETRQRLEARKQELAEIRSRRERFNNDREFVERLAHERHLVYPGEIVFQFDK